MMGIGCKCNNSPSNDNDYHLLGEGRGKSSPLSLLKTAASHSCAQPRNEKFFSGVILRLKANDFMRTNFTCN